MQIATYVPHVPVTTRIASASQAAPQKPDSSDNNDSVSIGSSFFQDTTIGRGLKNVAKGGLVAGGIPALGALGAQLGGAGVLGALAGATALGAYLGTKIDLDSSTVEKAAFGGALAAAGCMIGTVAGQVGGVGAGLLVAGTFGAMGAFRGVLETAAENNWI